MNPCPICQKPVDPIRASHVRVVGIRVIAYCSAACRDADAARAVGALASEAAAAAPVAVKGAPSGAVTVPVSKEAAKSAPVAAAKPVESKPAEAAKADAKGAEPSKLAEPPKKDGKAEKAEARPSGKTDKLDAKAIAKADGKGDKAEGKPAAKTDAKTDPKADTKAAKAAAKPDQGKKPDEPDTSDKGDRAKPAVAVEPAKADSKPRNADEERDNTLIPPEPKSRTGLIIAAVVVLALAAVGIWSATRSDPPPPPPPPPAPKPAVIIDARPPITPSEAQARAVEVLRAHLTSESARVQRFAAAALGRLGDEQAIQTLLALLPNEQSEIAKLDIAYGLARAGNERGLEMLSTGLRSARRDVKGDAARLLAALKDPRAESTLTSLLGLSQFRLGAAEQLARLGNKQGIAVLQRIRNDKPKPPDPSAPPPSPAEAEKAAEADKVKEADRLRATVALGYAGQKEVTEELRALLPNTGFNVGAAGALAVLGDPAARPVLVEQLRTPSLRVTAALSLRRLEPALDATPLLDPLMLDLVSEKDVERVGVAETILILTGPAALAERD